MLFRHLQRAVEFVLLGPPPPRPPPPRRLPRRVRFGSHAVIVGFRRHEPPARVRSTAPTVAPIIFHGKTRRRRGR